MSCVLDASAVLAYLAEEPGWKSVEEKLPGAFLSTANATEVASKLVDRGMPEELAWEAIELLDLKLVPVDIDTARAATALRETTRARGLSLGDRLCLGLAVIKDYPAVTADRAWGEVNLPCAVEIVR